MQTAASYLDQQIETNKSKNLLYSHAEQTMEIEAGFYCALKEMLVLASSKGSSEMIRADMVRYAVREVLKRIYSINQYLQVSRQKRDELEKIYRRTWETMLASGDIDATLRQEHYPELSRWLASVYPRDFREPLSAVPVVGRAVCEEYSARLQLEALHIDILDLREPVMDVGCGGRANLVRYLRAQGVEAFGIDRLLEVRAAYLEETDWFDYAFAPEQWGTIVSNMAITNHLMYAFHHDDALLGDYVDRVNSILGSLMVGGRFYCAPGVPMIEDEVDPVCFRVVRRRVTGDVFVSVVSRVG